MVVIGEDPGPGYKNIMKVAIEHFQIQEGEEARLHTTTDGMMSHVLYIIKRFEAPTWMASNRTTLLCSLASPSPLVMIIPTRLNTYRASGQ